MGSYVRTYVHTMAQVLRTWKFCHIKFSLHTKLIEFLLFYFMDHPFQVFCCLVLHTYMLMKDIANSPLRPDVCRMVPAYGSKGNYINSWPQWIWWLNRECEACNCKTSAKAMCHTIMVNVLRLQLRFSCY